jgi:UDP-glucose 4-epimerase
VTVREIADLALECLGLRAGSAHYHFNGGRVGWRGDVPVVRFNCQRISNLRWKPTMSSREALRDSMLLIISDIKEGRIEK